MSWQYRRYIPYARFSVYLLLLLGVVVRFVSIEQRNFEEEAGGVVTLLQEMKNERLAGDLFVDLLSEFMTSKPSTECIFYFYSLQPFFIFYIYF